MKLVLFGLFIFILTMPAWADECDGIKLDKDFIDCIVDKATKNQIKQLKEQDKLDRILRILELPKCESVGWIETVYGNIPVDLYEIPKVWDACIARRK